MKGGYQILDFKNAEILVDTPTLVTGAYERCISNGKPVMITGLRGVAGVSIYDGAYVSFAMDSDTAFVGTLAVVKEDTTLNVYTIKISPSDVVTITHKEIA